MITLYTMSNEIKVTVKSIFQVKMYKMNKMQLTIIFIDMNIFH